MVCRTSWFSGNQHTISLRIINQLSDAGLWSYAQEACSNWNASLGPQYCHATSYNNDSWVYMKVDEGLQAPNGYALNYDSNGNVVYIGRVVWSEVFLAGGDRSYGSLVVAITAHELGHTLGLAHHGSSGSNVTLMTSGSTRTKPTSIDIGPLPACSTNPVGSNGSGGVRCIYNGTI